jgi:hypothetical protein
MQVLEEFVFKEKAGDELTGGPDEDEAPNSGELSESDDVDEGDDPAWLGLAIFPSPRDDTEATTLGVVDVEVEAGEETVAAL